jgi:hypothetical protein
VLVEHSEAAEVAHRALGKLASRCSLVEQSVEKGDPQRSYEGHLLLRAVYARAKTKVASRFVDGRAVGAISTRFLSWCSHKLEALGKRVWVLIWDNASWHISREVRRGGSLLTTGL